MGVDLSTMRLNTYLREIFDKNYDKNMHKKITRQCAEFKQGLSSINVKSAAQKEKEKSERKEKKQKKDKAKENAPQGGNKQVFINSIPNTGKTSIVTTVKTTPVSEKVEKIKTPDLEVKEIDHSKRPNDKNFLLSPNTRKLLMSNYSTEQIEMLTSDINVKFKRQLGYTNRKKIEHSKLVNLSDSLMKQYLIDNVHFKKKLEQKLLNKH